MTSMPTDSAKPRNIRFIPIPPFQMRPFFRLRAFESMKSSVEKGEAVIKTCSGARGPNYAPFAQNVRNVATFCPRFAQDWRNRSDEYRFLLQSLTQHFHF